MRLIASRIEARLRDESGVALVMAIMLMTILALTTGAVLLSSALNQRNSLNSASARQAFALAETALAYGEGAVYSAGQSGQTPPSGTQTIPAQPGGGTASWSASVAPDGYTWTIDGEGVMKGVSRHVHAVATTPSSTTVSDTGVWNYLYGGSTSGHAGGTCETTITGGTTVSVPVLVRDNLCITRGAAFTNPTSGTPNQLKVGNNLSLSGAPTIGSSTSKIGVLEVGGTCSFADSSWSTTAGTAPCDGAHSPIYATKATRTVDVTMQMPCIGQPASLAGTGDTGCDGTWSGLKSQYNTQAALAKSGCPSNLLDNNSTLNDSLSASTLTGAMFSTTAYDCKVGSNEIKWTPAGSSCGSGTLYATGTLIFDGSLSLGCGWSVTYTGQASLYFTGTVTINGGVNFCGIAACTTSWNPDVNGLILIAACWSNSTGSTLTTSSCVRYTGGAHVQVGSYATTQYTIDGGATNMGPALASTLSLTGGGNSLVPFHSMPPGTPLNTRTVNIPAAPPANWSG